MLKNMNRWRVCEVWIAVCAVGACAAATVAAPSMATVTVLVALSLVPAVSVMLWWPSELPALTPGAWRAKS